MQAQATRSFSTTAREWAEMIKLEHTVFALPFALSGLILASPGLPSPSTVVWTILAFAGARAAAMTLNRIIDAKIDSKNPRTAQRAIPSGRISIRSAVWAVIASFALMGFAAAHLPPLCLMLSPIAVVWLSIYSFTKRFTWLCHFFLGIALGGAALGGWIAANGHLNSIAPWILALAVSAWVAGFDMIYALQDVEVDRAQGIFSLPAIYGNAQGLRVSRLLHVITVAALVGVGLTLSLGMFYWIGVLLVACMLVYEHSLVSPTDISRLNAAFFNVNGFVSILMFLVFLVDKLIKPV
jgi:4-hydroxybenzoate polyprenyltransferase